MLSYNLKYKDVLYCVSKSAIIIKKPNIYCVQCVFFLSIKANSSETSNMFWLSVILLCHAEFLLSVPTEKLYIARNLLHQDRLAHDLTNVQPSPCYNLSFCSWAFTEYNRVDSSNRKFPNIIKASSLIACTKGCIELQIKPLVIFCSCQGNNEVNMNPFHYILFFKLSSECHPDTYCCQIPHTRARIGLSLPDPLKMVFHFKAKFFLRQLS